MAVIAASMRRCTVASSIVDELLGGKLKAAASRGRGEGVRLRDALRMRSRAMSRRREGEGRTWKSCGVSEALVSCLVAGLPVSSGVGAVTSGWGGGVSAGVGVGVDAFPHRKDM